MRLDDLAQAVRTLKPNEVYDLSNINEPTFNLINNFFGAFCYIESEARETSSGTRYNVQIQLKPGVLQNA